MDINISVIITSYREPKTVKKAISSVLDSSANLWEKMELIVIAPDRDTVDSAMKSSEEYKLKGFSNFKVIRDNASGKPVALNVAVREARGRILFFTDGDMYLSENAVNLLLPYFDSEEIGGVSGHPVSVDSRNTMFGYFSHLFCEAAHIKRLNDNTTPMSGYIYAIRNISQLFPIPQELRAEDAYLSSKILERGYKIMYEPNAMAYAKFPKNFNDWMKQKTRSLGGNVQLKNYQGKSRHIMQDIKMALFPLAFAKTPKEFLYSLALYPLRLYLWIRIYLQHFTNSYQSGPWERIESSK